MNTASSTISGRRTARSGQTWIICGGRYEVRELSDEFMEWGCSERYFYYDERLNAGEAGPPTIMKNGGIHHGMVATYGNWTGRKDSSFHLNVATKGTALCPSRDTILELLPVLEKLKVDEPARQNHAVLSNHAGDLQRYKQL